MTQLVSIALFLSPLINTNGVFNSLQGVYIIMTSSKITDINLGDRELQAAVLLQVLSLNCGHV